MIKWLLHVGLALTILLGHGVALAEADWKALIHWRSYNDVQPHKNGSSRKIFIYFFSKRCHYCRLLEKDAFSNDTIASYINDNYTAIIVDTDEEREIVLRNGVNGVPDLRFLTPQGKQIARLPGYVPPETLLNLLQYIQTDSYKTMDINEFVKNKKDS